MRPDERERYISSRARETETRIQKLGHSDNIANESCERRQVSVMVIRS